MKIILKTEIDTEDLAIKFSRIISTPLIIGFTGELGVGKTHFIRSIIQSFNSNERVKVLSFSLENELLHYLILATAAPISLMALFLGFKNHQSNSFLFIGITGLCLMTMAVVLGEGMIGEAGERFLTTIGSLIVAFAHFLNHRACKKLECDKCHD